jgi:DMSO reductase anchor subunit
VTVPAGGAADGGRFLPAAPDPGYTRPTTRYLSRRGLPPNLVAADAATLRVQPAHWPLVVLLTAFPAAVGCSLAAALRSGGTVVGTEDVKLAAVVLGAAGLAASGFHLGQPRRAWRIFLGWRRSWLSREALLCGGWFGLALAALVFPAITLVAAAVGLAGLACSAMIYVDTRRHFWRAGQTFPRFFGTTALVAAGLLVPWAAALILIALLAWELRTRAPDDVSARLQRGPLRRLVAVRTGLGLAGAVLLAIGPGPGTLAVVLAAELAGRLLYFRAVDAPKMPGLPTA